jgi:phosphopantetheinyl transferase (holo-ACP synthase)
VKAQSERLTKRGLVNTLTRGLNHTGVFGARKLCRIRLFRLRFFGDSAAYCAKRFAAKEAFAKALGTGIGRIVRAIIE